jgi:hypothetical protein
MWHLLSMAVAWRERTRTQRASPGGAGYPRSIASWLVFSFLDLRRCLEVTHAGCFAAFTLPARPYRFRVDVNGTQTWSGVVSVVPGTEVMEVIDVLP